MFKQIQSQEKIKLQFTWLENYVYKRKPVYPISIEVDASNVCPLSCKHCVWGNMLEQNNEIMSEEHLFSIVNQASKLGVKSILWTGGGEPLTNKSLVKVIKRSKELGIKNAMFTNGLLLWPKISEELSECLEWIRFNVGVADAQSYGKYYGVSDSAFNTVCDNIHYYCALKNQKSEVGIGTAVNKENFQFAKNIPLTAIKLGATYCQIKPDILLMQSKKYINWWNDCVEPYFNRLKNNLSGEIKLAVVHIDNRISTSSYCHTHHVITSITADGRVNFCKMKRNEKISSLGNIKEKSLKEIFESTKHHFIASQINPQTCTETEYCPYVSTNNYIDDLLQTANNIGPRHSTFF